MHLVIDRRFLPRVVQAFVFVHRRRLDFLMLDRDVAGEAFYAKVGVHRHVGGSGE